MTGPTLDLLDLDAGDDVTLGARAELLDSLERCLRADLGIVQFAHAQTLRAAETIPDWYDKSNHLQGYMDGLLRGLAHIWAVQLDTSVKMLGLVDPGPDPGPGPGPDAPIAREQTATIRLRRLPAPLTPQGS
jgi:hypothetical protein